MAWHGERLKEIRLARGIPQDALAAEIDVNPRMIPRYEKKRTDDDSSKPSADIAARIAKILGCSADFLLGLSDSPGTHFADVSGLSPDEERLIRAIRNKKPGKAASEFATLMQDMG